jgi:RecA-family ATPase
MPLTPDQVDEVFKSFGDEPRAAADEPLPYVDIALDLRARVWHTPERIPGRNVTLLSGEGAIGKSTLLMQLMGATVLAGSQWLGTCPAHGPALYLTAEEEDNEVRLRLEAVADSLGTSRQRLKEDGLHVLSFAGRDAILGEPDRNGIIRPTRLFNRIREDALRLKPKLIGLDAAADVFAGKENDRGQTRQFITMLRGLAMATDSAVALVAHPSIEGIRSDSGLSGSTAWHNSVRARMYFKKAPGEDKSLRVLEVKKNNYGPEQENILLRWRDGVYVVEPGAGTLERLAADAEIDHLFLKLLRQFAEQGRTVSDKKSPTHAPSLFADEPEAKATKATKKALAEAMARLFTAGKLRVVTIGSASRMRSHIVETDREADEQAAILPFPTPLPTGFQHPSNGVLTHTPRTPLYVGRGQGGVGSPPPSNGDGGSLPPGAEVVGKAGPGERCWQCGAGSNVLLIRRQPGEEPSQLHADCAVRAWTASAGGIPFMITQLMREQLRARGYADDAIANLTPARAHEILAADEPAWWS